MNSVKDITANYKTQYQITVTASPSGALGRTFKVTYTQCGTTYANVQRTTPWTEWADASTDVIVSEPQAIISVTADTRYKFDSYSPSASVHMDQARTITLVYKTQYLLVVRTDPLELSPQPTRNPAGEAGSGWWYDNSTNVVLEANLTAYLNTVKYTFIYWDVDGNNRMGNPITVHMNQSHTATAHYAAPHGPKANFTETPVSPSVGREVTFNASSSQPGWNGTHTISITQYRWDFGDGVKINTTSPVVKHTYMNPGTYNVTLTVYAPGATPDTDTTWHMKTVQRRVGGYIVSIDKPGLLVPSMGFGMALVATIALTTLLIRRKGKRSAKV